MISIRLNLLIKYHGDFENKNIVFKETDYLEFSKNNTLKEIIVKTNGNQFKRYAITYADNGTNYQFVNKVTEYNSNDQYANPITIEYEPYQASNEETTKENNIANTNTKK